MNLSRLTISCLATVILCLCARGQTWQPIANPAPFKPMNHVLMTDGTVMVHEVGSKFWWHFTPDINGSYANGTWTRAGSMNADPGPIYYASAVLPDGRLVVMGGEYIGLGGPPVYAMVCEIYDPTTEIWTPFAPPAGWTNIGDAQCTVLPNGQVLLASTFDTRDAILDPATMTWTLLAGFGKVDQNHEEGWELLPDGTILTVDAISPRNSEIFNPASNTWSFGGTLPNDLSNGHELGPAVLRFDGSVLAMGAMAHNAIFHPAATPGAPGTWSAAPDFPLNSDGLQLCIADGPACLLPNGNVFAATSPEFTDGIEFFEFDDTAGWIPIPSIPSAATSPSYLAKMLMLPTGQVIFIDLDGQDLAQDVEIYTPSGGPRNEWRPTISSYPTVVAKGVTYSIGGIRYNGFSQTTGYGDDVTNATNYPLVRITNIASGHVFYCRTHGHSTMAVATGLSPTSTNFDVPNTVEPGPSNIEVIANGIPSLSRSIDVSYDAASLSSMSPSSMRIGTSSFMLTVSGGTFYDKVSTVTFNGVALSTKFVDKSTLTAVVPHSLLTKLGAYSVQVINVAPGDGSSNALTFRVVKGGK